MIYFLLCAVLIIFCFIDGISNSPKASQFAGVFIAIVLVFFAGLRDRTGTDWFSYIDFYKYGSETTEQGYILINNIFSKANLHYNLFLVFINIISLTLIFIAFKKHAKLVAIAFLLYYCELYLYFNFSGMRQAIAISITLFSITYVVERNFLKFAFCILLASTFHVTSMLFFVAYFIPRKRMELLHYIFLAVFFLSISSILFAGLNLASGNLGDKLKFYLEIDAKAEDIKSLFLIGIIKRSFVLFTLLIFGKPFFKLKENIYYFNAYLFGFGIYLSTYLLSPDMGVRLGAYFLIFDTLIVARLIFANSGILRRLSIVGLFSIIALYKIYTYVKLDPYEYHSIIKLND